MRSHSQEAGVGFHYIFMRRDTIKPTTPSNHNALWQLPLSNRGQDVEIQTKESSCQAGESREACWRRWPFSPTLIGFGYAAVEKERHSGWRVVVSESREREQQGGNYVPVITSIWEVLSLTLLPAPPHLVLRRLSLAPSLPALGSGGV